MNKTFLSVIGIVGVAVMAYFVWGISPQAEPDNTPKYASFQSGEFAPEFAYPIVWGDVTLKDGVKECPPEDTYFTQDTLYWHHFEYAFEQMTLPGSESFISTGIKLLEINPKRLIKCGGKFHYDIATMKLKPETISSVKLTPITNISGLVGTYNEEASRLNTASRRQYTYYVKSESNNNIYVVQPYMVFTPHAGSPELAELEEKFAGNMANYLKDGVTAAKAREYFADFKILAEGIKFRGE
jgi:hypothetical protein